VKKALLILGTVLAISLALNAGYFWKQVTHRLDVDSSPAFLPITGKIGEPDMIMIERLGIQAPIIYVEEESEKTYQSALGRGVVHYPGSAEVGRPGNVFIFGHSSDYPWKEGEYKTVFALLPEIRRGDSIVATDRNGRVFRYEVTSAFVASADEVGLLDQGDGTKGLLTLQTSYPLGTALKRFIVQAELVE
jgi:LPXTG-site transpeptidase (sortase) family protein